MSPIKGEGTVYQRKSDNMWVCAIDLGTDETGRRRRKTVTAKNKADLIAKRRKLIRDLEDGIDIIHTNMTVAAWLDRWHQDIAKARLHPGVWTNYRTHLDRHIKPAIGKQKLADLGPAHIRAMHKRIADTPSRNGGGKVSGSLVLACHSVLAKALKDAVREGLIRDNPCDRVDRPVPKYQQREPLTADDAKQLLLSSGESGDPLAAMWATALLTGSRQSELMGLTWDRVNLDTGTIDLEWQLQHLPSRHGCTKPGGEPRCGIKRAGMCPQRILDVPDGFEHQHVHRSLCFTRPKTSTSIRYIPIPPLLVQALATHRETAIDNEWGLVWARKDGTPYGHREIQIAWKAAVEKAGLPPCHMHATRHTTASLLLELGVPMEVIAQILGHSTILTTRGYAHANLEMAQKAMAQLGQALTN